MRANYILLVRTRLEKKYRRRLVYTVSVIAPRAIRTTLGIVGNCAIARNVQTF